MQSNEIIHAQIKVQHSCSVINIIVINFVRHKIYTRKHKVHFKWSKNATFHYITLKTIYSGLSKSNFKYHYGDAAIEQCLGIIAEINVFSVSDEML